MKNWPSAPRVYEINTWVWLNSLSQQYDSEITLATIPDPVIYELASYDVDVIWLMGVYHHSTAVRNSALNYVHEYRHALPDITNDDVKGSAYAIGKYEVDERIGGLDGLLAFRERLNQQGLKLILDFVPNHVATDHQIIATRPDYFVQGTEDMIEHEPGNFFRTGDVHDNEIIIAHGRDPYFSGWIDTAQLNAFSTGYREAAVQVLLKIAEWCDGVRCDMAMLMLNSIFERTWGWTGLEAPKEDFWNYVIPKVLYRFPNFVFMAETYWGLDYELQQQGFDYTYDKVAYDRILEGNVNALYEHLTADLSFLERNIRFIENHDENRAISAMGVNKSMAAAVVLCTLPGAVLLHDGQFDGRRVKLPVHIQRQPHEHLNTQLRTFYLQLLKETSKAIYKQGTWTLFHREGVEEDDHTWQSIIAFGWVCDEEFRLILVNFAPHRAQAVVKIPDWGNILRDKRWHLFDVLHNAYRDEDGQKLTDDGLRITLAGHQARIFAVKEK